MEAIEAMAHSVWESLDAGLSEAVYHHALEIELRLAGIPYQSEKIVPIEYKGHTVGNVRTDLIIDNKLIVELKSISKLNGECVVQIELYSKLLGLPGIVINFPTKHGKIEVYKHEL